MQLTVFTTDTEVHHGRIRTPHPCRIENVASGLDSSFTDFPLGVYIYESVFLHSVDD